MGNVIETDRSMGSDYWAAYVGGEKLKQTDLNDTPKPISLPINDLPKELHNMTKNDYRTKMETKKKS